ncbi:MAG TPA: type II CRISPR RNA-guided endonuclease Cas9 [Hyphomonadaceae bacterium]|nr:type II CRISPR RNA-guided endonuclease Cas9 [Hyphomonadaceae bacterium]
MARVFGLDIGTTSVGFAVVDLDNDRAQGRILRLGVRIFPEARDPDGTPLNQERRAKRMMRRQLRRRRQRRRALNEILAAAGLLPSFGSPDWPKVMASDPYALRDRGLAEALAPHELGRALYHLAKRRHFRPRALDETDVSESEVPDEKAATTERAATLDQLAQSGATLGQWLHRQPVGTRKRGHHATRDVVVGEFDRLWGAQAMHYPQLSADLRRSVSDAIFAQRPVFWRKSTLGRCRLQPDAPLCPKAAWISQQRRMLEKLNNLAIAGGNARPLDAEERAAVLAKLQTQGSMSWGAVRRALKPLFRAREESEKSVRFNLEDGGDPGLLGNPLEAKLAGIFGDDWAVHPAKSAIRHEVPALLWAADYGEVGRQRVVIRSDDERKTARIALRTRFSKDFEIGDTQAAALADLSMPSGWEPYSTVALERMLPELERGVRLGALLNGPEWQGWRDRTFPDRERPTGEFHDRLPSPKDRDEARRIAELRNPTVVRAQNELRKVVNNLIGLFGKPDLIRIELARDVGKSKREREEIQTAIRRNEKRRREAKKDLESKGIDGAPRDIEKWLLWRESQERCPYTGDHVSFDDLFRNNRYQVEHIWPRSRSLDNSARNKTLCRVDVNIAKGNQTPFEFFRSRPDDWAALKDRLDKLVGRDGMSAGKVRRFLAETMPDDFAARQLADTGYAARQAIAFLRRLWPDLGPDAPVTVQAVSGRVVAQLRKRWGLNNILSDDGEKTRRDHRHHAVDALAVACAHGGYAQLLSAYFQDERHGLHPHLAEPWPTIRRDAEAAVAEIVVSHRVRKKISGPLHKATTYGDTLRNDAKTGTYRLFVTRKPLVALTKSEIFSTDPEVGIRDLHIRRIVQDWVTAHGGDPKKAFATHPRLGTDGPEIRRVRLTTKQQLQLMARASTGYADLAGNHHIEIFRTPNGKADYRVVSLHEAARRLASRRPVVDRVLVGAVFVMSLAPGDTLSFPLGEKRGLWVVQGVWAAGPIVLLRANDALGESVTRPNAGALLREDAVKVAVDPIGRIRPAGD